MEKLPITLIADNIRSLYNIGSLFRIGDGINASEILLTGISGYPDLGEHDTRRPYLKQKQHAELKKTALSGLEAVKCKYFNNNLECIEYLKNLKTQIICVEQTKASILYTNDFELENKIAIIFGNELDGVSDEWLKIADKIVEIPMYGVGKSLNVSSSAAIVSYTLASRMIKRT